MTTKHLAQGFTILELLVVIAVIAVLAAIVLVNVTQYINKGNNAAIKANLATILTNSATYFETQHDYASFCTSSGYTNPAAAIAQAGGSPICNVSDDTTAVCACSTELVTNQTPAGTTFCVDSNGTKVETQTDCALECTTITGTCQ